jgi:hypothetical protein
MNRLLESAVDWAQRHKEAVARRGVSIDVTFGPDDRDKRSLWIDFDSPDRLVRLMLWQTGEAILSVAEVSTGDVLLEDQLELSDQVGIDHAMRDAVAWASGNGR